MGVISDRADAFTKTIYDPRLNDALIENACFAPTVTTVTNVFIRKKGKVQITSCGSRISRWRGRRPVVGGTDLLCGCFSVETHAKTKELGPVGPATDY